jgi:hypothetical protein
MKGLGIALILAALAGATPPGIATLRGHRRIVLIAAPQGDPAAATQQAMIAQWHPGADDRDVWVVTVAGPVVTGAADAATMLRQRYRLNPARFQVLLIGKDGHVALRAAHPVTAARLQQIIDAMPMRRAGER